MGRANPELLAPVGVSAIPDGATVEWLELQVVDWRLEITSGAGAIFCPISLELSASPTQVTQMGDITREGVGVSSGALGTVTMAGPFTRAEVAALHVYIARIRDADEAGAATIGQIPVIATVSGIPAVGRDHRLNLRIGLGL